MVVWRGLAQSYGKEGCNRYLGWTTAIVETSLSGPEIREVWKNGTFSLNFLFSRVTHSRCEQGSPATATVLML